MNNKNIKTVYCLLLTFLFIIFILPFVSSEKIDFNIIKEHKVLFLHDDDAYQCVLNGNEVSSDEKIEVVKNNKKSYTNIDYVNIDFKNKVKEVSLSKIIKKNNKDNKKNTYSLLEGDVLKCGDDCDVFSIGDKTYINVSDNIISTIIDLVVWNGNNYVDLLYGIVECENPTENKWNYTNINYDFQDNNQLVFIMNSTHDIFYNYDRMNANFYAISDKRLTYNFEVVEDTCWITDDGKSSCLRFNHFEYDTYFNEEENETLNNLQYVKMFFNSTNGWSNFNSSEIDPIVSKEETGESSVSTVGWVNKLSNTFYVNSTGYYVFFGMQELAHNDVGTSAYGRIVVDNVVISNVSHESKDYDKTRFYISQFGHTIKLLSVGNHTINIDYATELNGETTYSRNARISAIPLYIYHYSENNNLRGIVQNVNTTVQELNFTVNESGTYIFFVSDDYSPSSTLYSIIQYVTINNALVDVQQFEAKDSTDIRSFSFHNVSYLTPGNYNIKLIAYTTSNNGKIKYSRISAIKTDGLFDMNSVESLTESSTSSSVYVNKLQKIITLDNQSDYILIASANMGQSLGSNQVDVAFQLDGVSYCNQIFEPKEVGTISDRERFVCFFNTTLDTSTHTARIVYKANNGGVAYINNARITLATEHITILNITQPMSYVPIINNVTFDRLLYYGNTNITMFFDHQSGNNVSSNISIMWFVNDVSVLNITHVNSPSGHYNFSLPLYYYNPSDVVSYVLRAYNEFNTTINIIDDIQIFDSIECFFNDEPQYNYLKDKLYYVCIVNRNSKCLSYLYEVDDNTLISVAPDIKDFNDYKQIEYFNQTNYGNFFSSDGGLLHPYFIVRDVLPLHNYTFVIQCSEDNTGLKFQHSNMLQIKENSVEYAYIFSFFSMENAILLIGSILFIIIVLILGKIAWNTLKF